MCHLTCFTSFKSKRLLFYKCVNVIMDWLSWIQLCCRLPFSYDRMNMKTVYFTFLFNSVCLDKEKWKSLEVNMCENHKRVDFNQTIQFLSIIPLELE